jgi:hypothetical protein
VNKDEKQERGGTEDQVKRIVDGVKNKQLD